MGHKVDSCNTDLHKLFYTPEFYEAIYVDEFQDFREKDFEIIKMMVLNVENILLVGDYYQHSVSGKNNTGMPFKDGKKSISYEQFISELASCGFEVDSHSLNKSRRCSAEVCTFIREKLGIKIFSKDIHQGKIIEVPEDRVKEIISNDDIVKLVYSNAKSYNCFCKNWSYSKGDTYDSICVVLTEKSNNIFKENWNNNLSESSRNKLYVALTRSSGDVYIMSSQQFAREVSK
ncbi:UvrD-helicase domain-containing protein [Megasphaera sp. BL7]|nr:UvrD-helicase domain-containing protein [Megasphaera sp. BL7]